MCNGILRVCILGVEDEVNLKRQIIIYKKCITIKIYNIWVDEQEAVPV